MAQSTVYIPSGRFPEGVQKRDLSFTLTFEKKRIFIDDEFDICVFLKGDGSGDNNNDFQVTLSRKEIEILKVVDHDNSDGVSKTIQEFMDDVVEEEIKKMKNKERPKKHGPYHYNNGVWEEASHDDDD
jgi:hypothetical protein